jgi:hypothetical protein
VCCWDTSEPARLHPPDPSAAPPPATLPPPRRPSYTTEAAAPSSAIVGRVVALRCLLRSGGGGGAAGGGVGTRASLSLLVLGEGGQLAVFGVVLLKSAAAAAAQSDAGMRVGEFPCDVAFTCLSSMEPCACGVSLVWSQAVAAVWPAEPPAVT